MSASSCVHCGADNTTGTALCPRCTTTVRFALGRLADEHEQLLSIGRSSTRSRRPGGHADPVGSAVAREVRDDHDEPDEVAAETRNTVVTWVRVVVEQRGARWPRDTVPDMTRFLRHQLRTIVTLEWSEEFTRELLDTERRVHRLVQRSKGRWYAGMCSNELTPARPHDATTCLCACHTGQACDIDCRPEQATIPAEYCERELFAVPSSDTVWCPSCKQTWALQARRRFLLDEAREAVLPLADVARSALVLVDGEPSLTRLHRRLMRQADRGRLRHVDVDVVAGRPTRLYRLGDALDTLALSKPRTGL